MYHGHHAQVHQEWRGEYVPFDGLTPAGSSTPDVQDVCGGAPGCLWVIERGSDPLRTISGFAGPSVNLSLHKASMHDVRRGI